VPRTTTSYSGAISSIAKGNDGRDNWTRNYRKKKIAGVKEKRGRMRGCGEAWCLELSGEL
jgi:hypothetical protein